MKMSKSAEKALRASIKHWKVDVLKDHIIPHSGNCPLCEYFGSSCYGCPLEDPKEAEVCNILYFRYIGDSNMTEGARRRHAIKMIKFMEDLLPRENEK